MLQKLFKKERRMLLWEMINTYPKLLYYTLIYRKCPIKTKVVTHILACEADFKNFQAMLQQPTFATLQHICIFPRHKRLQQAIEQLTDVSHVTFVSSFSFAALRALATSRWIVAYTPLEPFFTKRHEQQIFYIAHPSHRQDRIYSTLCIADRILISPADKNLEKFAPQTLGEALQSKCVSALQDLFTPSQSSPTTTQKRFLIYADTLKLNGITSSLLNLLRVLIQEGNDVTLVTQRLQPVNIQPVLEQLPKEVHLLLREPAFCLTPWQGFKRLLFKRFGQSTRWGRWATDKKWWQEDIRRLIGTSHFDCAIEFVGYSADGAMLMLAASSDRKLIWGHADIVAEYHLKHPRLRAVFSLYSQFDAFVSCSEALCDINQRSLADPNVCFEACKNFANPQRIIEGLAHAQITTIDGHQWLISRAFKDSEPKRILLDIASPSGAFCTPTHRFIMVGRLSPEKNYEATIRAFAQFIAKGHHAKLFIVGEGPLAHTLQTLITSLNMTAYITLVGRLYNPAELMAACSCFMLTSLHEGQPMVIHEARTANLPILMSRFGAYLDVALPDGQILVETDEASILAGLEAFAAGTTCPYTYDATAYNKAVLKTFYRLCFKTERM